MSLNCDIDDMQHDIYATLGASNHSNEERDPNDYYATDPRALELLLDEYGGEIDLRDRIWEPAAGGGHLAEALRKRGHYVYASDVVDHGYEYDRLVDFFKMSAHTLCDIVTNPPYKLATEFIEHALDLVPPGGKVLMFLKVTFLEGKKRKEMFKKYPPKAIYVSSSRLQCAKGGNFDKYANGTGTAIAYAWFLWEKGYSGDTVVRWFN